jgi:hypothetical protein
MIKKLFFCVVLTYSVALKAQYYDSNNHIGITGGYSYMNIITKDFVFTPTGGWNAGFTTRGMFYNNFDMVYGIDFHTNNFTLPGSWNNTSRIEAIPYQLINVQIHLLGSYRAISNHLNFDFGPVFQINDRLKTEDEKYQNHYINNTTFKATDIEDVSKIQVYLGGGISGGAEHIRASIFYQYSLNNFFNKLNKTDPVNFTGANLSANLSVLTANVIFYL